MANYFQQIILVLIVAFFLNLNPLECKHINDGFTVDLIRHHQSHKSISSSSTSSHSNSSSHFEWLGKSFQRSLSRSLYFKNRLISKQSPSEIVDSSSPLTGLGGEYVMEVYIGDPAVKIVAIADTGIDVAWTQCKLCINCYKQNDPLFDTNKSSSYRKLSCDSHQCSALQSTSCDDSNKCSYQLAYGDKSRSIGDLAVDTFSFAANRNSFPNTTFGCAHDSTGNFNGTASGIIGLGGGQLSIVNQFSTVLSKKFSYCLVPIGESVSSKISFGVDSIPKGSKGAVSTPLIKGTVDTFYYITLEGVSVVGDDNITQRLMLNDYNSSGVEQAEGNIIIDSGTTLTILPSQIYQDLKSALSFISIEPATDPSGVLDLCYQVGTDSAGFKFPDLVFHFKGGDVVIPALNSFIEVSRGVVCLTMVPTDDVALFGNLSQMNFLVEYDIDNQLLSFLPTDCTKFH